MDSHTVEVLGFPRVREILAGLCATDMGREQALALEPSSSRAQVETELDRLDEVTALSDEPPLSDVKDLRPLLAQLRASGQLTGEELVRVRLACVGVRRCREFFRNHKGTLPRVEPLVQELIPQPHLEREIEQALDEASAVRDSATPELADIRRRLRRMRNVLVERLERVAADNPEWFGGGATVRGGRFVLPLLLEHRARVQGVIHGSSGSGSTLFVEPLEMVADGNELQELWDAEAEEVARILRRLSGQVAEREPELGATMAAAGALDLLVAKRRLSARLDCRRPELAGHGRLEIVRARHPLLVHRKVSVVPLDMRFPDGKLVVLISGPNAGGKTVVLKTLGLLSLMLNAGMHLPVAKGTRLPVFQQVFADIGDEQSLDSDLSSFTAHVGRLKEILLKADAESLVLIDEIGSSTAPEEGAALAVAVLESLRDNDVTTVATTHFGALKMFAQDEPGMANAAMEWGQKESPKSEVQSPKSERGPTYRLKMGFPGESSAFEIAAQAGLPGRVIERARTRVGREWLDMAAKLRSLDEEINRAKVARSGAELEQQSAARLRQEYEARLEESRTEAEAARDRASAELERVLRQKRREIENLVRQIREQKASHESVVAAKKHIEQELELAQAESREPDRPVAGPPELKPGDAVESHTFRRQGVVVELSENRATVAFGQIKVELATQDLKLVQPAEVKAEPAPAEEPYRFDTRLDVIGMNRDEADEAVTKFLEEACATGSAELSIVHGKGGGVLRRALWDRLRRDSRIETVRLAESSAGGSGVTVVKLKGQA